MDHFDAAGLLERLRHGPMQQIGHRDVCRNGLLGPA
jgi:hypothetical protein